MSVLSAVAVDIYKQNTEGFQEAWGIISWLFPPTIFQNVIG